jgi:hypothetical protein
VTFAFFPLSFFTRPQLDNIKISSFSLLYFFVIFSFFDTYPIFLLFLTLGDVVSTFATYPSFRFHFVWRCRFYFCALPFFNFSFRLAMSIPLLRLTPLLGSISFGDVVSTFAPYLSLTFPFAWRCRFYFCDLPFF